MGPDVIPWCTVTLAGDKTTWSAVMLYKQFTLTELSHLNHFQNRFVPNQFA